jgi:hypothetical protein
MPNHIPKNCVDLGRGLIFHGVHCRGVLPPRRQIKISSGFAERIWEKLDNCRGVGEKMTYAEFENLILLADRMITSCVPRKAEYGRGYQSGIKFNFYNPQPESLPDHYSLVEVARREGSRDVHAYARGYRDGCKGLKPKDTG